METNGMDRTLVCVLVPGIVKNDEKALQCLGGIRCISQVSKRNSTYCRDIYVISVV